MTFLLLILSAVALEPNSLNLKSLSDASMKEVKLNSQKPSLIVVFQKNCSACRKQVKELKCLKDSSKVFLVGAFSNEIELRREYRLFNTKHEAFYGDQTFLKRFKIKTPATPQIIFINKNSYRKVLGFRPCKELLNQQSL